MSKRQLDYNQPIEFDTDYEEQVARLETIDGHVSDYPTTESRPQRTSSPVQTLVLPQRTPSNFVTSEEASLIGQTQQTVGQMMQWTGSQQTPDTSHTRQVDSAVTVAWASIVASLPMLALNAVITAGLIILAWMMVGGAGSLWALGWLVVWGGMGLFTLVQNRRLGLYHSSTGIAHHALENQAVEIQEKYQTARYAINRTFEFIENQRRITSDSSIDG